MSNRLPPLNALRAFEVSARLRSFSRAAEELNVTPAAISHQIKGLEEYLGTRLFNRANRTLMLTQEGQALLPGIRRGFSAFHDAMEAFGLHDETGLLNVAVTPSFASRWLVPRLESFNTAHPEIDIRMTTSMGLIDYDRDGIEIGVRYGGGEYPDLVAEPPAVRGCSAAAGNWRSPKTWRSSRCCTTTAIAMSRCFRTGACG